MMGAVVLRIRNGKCEMGMGIGMGTWVHGYPPAFRPFGALKPIENQFHLTKSQKNVCVASPNLQNSFLHCFWTLAEGRGGGEKGSASGRKLLKFNFSHFLLNLTWKNLFFCCHPIFG